LGHKWVCLILALTITGLRCGNQSESGRSGRGLRIADCRPRIQDESKNEGQRAMPIFYDTHAHMHYPELAQDLAQVIDRAAAAGRGVPPLTTSGTKRCRWIFSDSTWKWPRNPD